MSENHRRTLAHPGRPELGRSVNHDPRSLAYAVTADGSGPVTARWERITPVLDQGELGSCTGNAAVGLLGTHPFKETLVATARLDEAEAVEIYSVATRLDSAPGTYPPTDTGSDGLSVAKACKAAGLISGYRHILSLAAAHTAIQTGPFIVGTAWHADMDDPDPAGLVRPTGAVLGGHEYECVGYDVGTTIGGGRWEFVNSWGAGWGVAGHFFMTDADFAALLRDDGDATVFVPHTQPAPVPTPPPTPPPTPTPAPGPTPDVLAQVVTKLEELLTWIRGLR